MNSTESGRKRLQTTGGAIPEFSGMLRKDTKNISQDFICPDRDTKWESCEYKSKSVTASVTCSILILKNIMSSAGIIMVWKNVGLYNIVNLWRAKKSTISVSGVPRNFVRWGVSTNSVEDRGQREWGFGGGSPLVRGSGGSCNLVQKISFHIVKFS